MNETTHIRGGCPKFRAAEVGNIHENLQSHGRIAQIHTFIFPLTAKAISLSKEEIP
jgi:hypothetical protein